MQDALAEIDARVTALEAADAALQADVAALEAADVALEDDLDAVAEATDDNAADVAALGSTGTALEVRVSTLEYNALDLGYRIDDLEEGAPRRVVDADGRDLGTMLGFCHPSAATAQFHCFVVMNADGYLFRINTSGTFPDHPGTIYYANTDCTGSAGILFYDQAVGSYRDNGGDGSCDLTGPAGYTVPIEPVTAADVGLPAVITPPITLAQ